MPPWLSAILRSGRACALTDLQARRSLLNETPERVYKREHTKSAFAQTRVCSRVYVTPPARQPTTRQPPSCAQIFWPCV